MSDPLYAEMIIDEAKNARNKGELENPDAQHQDSNPMCGDNITIQIKIKDDSIEDIKWKENAQCCTICQACSSVLTQIVKGKDLNTAKDLDKKTVLSELGLEYLATTSPVRIKCALLSLKTLKLALYSYLTKNLQDATVDKLKEEATNLY